MRALVVDDSRAIRCIIGRTLRELGFDLWEAGDGEEAHDRLAEVGRVDLILLDWHMPELDGFDFLLAVRSRPDCRGTVIMVITTETERHQMQRALEAGADEYVMKPFTGEVLREKLQLVGLTPG